MIARAPPDWGILQLWTNNVDFYEAYHQGGHVLELRQESPPPLEHGQAAGRGAEELVRAYDARAGCSNASVYQKARSPPRAPLR